MHPLKTFKQNRRRQNFLLRKMVNEPDFDGLTDDTLLDRMSQPLPETFKPERKVIRDEEREARKRVKNYSRHLTVQ